MISGLTDTWRERERERDLETQTSTIHLKHILVGLIPRERRPIPQAEQGEGTPLTHPSSSLTHPTPATHSSSSLTQ